MTVLIKKYKNRRLYDTEKSQYITVDDLREYVLKNKAFEVRDAASGKDLTNMTLLQILLEMENSSMRFLSGDILRHLILLAHHPLQQSMNSMLENAFSSMKGSNMDNNPWAQSMEEWKKYMNMMKDSFKKPE